MLLTGESHFFKYASPYAIELLLPNGIERLLHGHVWRHKADEIRVSVGNTPATVGAIHHADDIPASQAAIFVIQILVDVIPWAIPLTWVFRWFYTRQCQGIDRTEAVVHATVLFLSVVANVHGRLPDEHLPAGCWHDLLDFIVRVVK